MTPTPTTTSTTPKITQQDFLRAAMAELGGMTRNAFSLRLGCARRTLDKWLAPLASGDYRNMDETIWNLVNEILAHEKLKAQVAKTSKTSKKISDTDSD